MAKQNYMSFIGLIRAHLDALCLQNRKAAQYFSEEFRNRSKKLYVGTILAPSNHPIDPKLFEIDGLDLENAPATHNRRAGSLAICDLMTTKYGVRPGKSAHNAPNKNSNCKYFKKTQTFFFPLEVVNNGVRNPKTDTAKQNVIFQPITGAKHQIRALYYFRAPILGDKKYMRFSKVHKECNSTIPACTYTHACYLFCIQRHKRMLLSFLRFQTIFHDTPMHCQRQTLNLIWKISISPVFP